MAEYWRRMRELPRSLWLMLLAIGLALFVWQGLLAVLYNLYLLRLGFDAQAIGLLVGFGTLVWGLAALPAGLLSNRIGLRTSMQIGIGLYGLGIALTLLVEHGVPPEQWRAYLIGCQIVMNIGIAAATVAVPPYIMSMTSHAQRPHAFGVLAALNPLAAFLGSIVAGILPGWLASRQGYLLDQPEPYRLALWVGPVLCLIAVITLGAVSPGAVGNNSVPNTKQAAKSGAPFALLAFWALVVFLAAIGEGTVRTFFNVLLDAGLRIPPASIGMVMGIGQLLPIAVALVVPLLLTRWGTGYTLLAGIAVLAACLVPFAFGAQLGAHAGPVTGPALWLIGGSYLAATATFSVIRAGRNLFGQELVVDIWRTSSQGAGMLGLAFGLSVAGVAGGALIAAYGFGALYAAGAVSALLSAGLLYGYLQWNARHQAREAVSGAS
jgi:MFS family permease